MTRRLLAAAALAAAAACSSGPTKPPQIASFTASPSLVEIPNTVTLSWSVKGATAIALDQNVGDVTGKTSLTLRPLKDVTYTLTAANAKGQVTATAAIHVVNAAAQLRFSGTPSSTGAGQQFGFTVSAFDAFNKGAPLYKGTVHFTSDDPLAQLPADYTFTAGDAGVHAFQATLFTAGSHTVAAVDTSKSSIAGRSDAIPVAPGAASQLVKVSGDGQTAAVSAALKKPLVARAADQYGNAVAGVAVGWSADNGASLSSTSATSDAEGLVSTQVTLGSTLGTTTITAAAAGLSSAVFTATVAAPGTSLAYADPPAGGKLRLVKNAASTSTRLVLDLVTAVDLTGYSAGFDLATTPGSVQLSATNGFTPGSALSPGTGVVAAAGALPVTGRYANMIVTGLSQKAAGAGAVATDTLVPAGSVLYSVALELAPGALTGLAFDGSGLYRAAFRDFAGNDVAGKADFAIGTLTIQ